MKYTTRCLLYLSLMFSGVNAYALTPQETNARDKVYRYLTDNNYTCEFDSRDESLNFRYNGTLYWITFKSDGENMIYTLHRKPIVMVKQGEEELQANLNRENGALAANMMTAGNSYKAFLNGDKIELQFPNISSTPEEYSKVLMDLLDQFESSKMNFNQEFAKAEALTESLHNFWTSPELTMVALPSTGNSASPLYINRVDFQNETAHGSVISEYGYPLDASRMEYLRPRVNLQARDKAKGIYILTVKLIDPDGRTIVRDWALNFTSNSVVEVKNTNAQNYPLSSIGTDSRGFWMPGAYQIEIYNEGELIYNQTFTIQDN